MELLKLLLGINLIFIAIKSVINNDKSVEFFNRKFESIKFVRYNIDLTLFMNEKDYLNADFYKKTFHNENIDEFESYIYKQRTKGNFIFYGESTIYIEDIKKNQVIRLHALNLKIDENATKIVFTANGTDVTVTPKEHVYHKEAQTIDIYFNFLNSSLYDVNTYRLIMKFVGSISDNTGGFFKTSYTNGGDKIILAAADFQGIGARQIFPCWDQPYIRTNFTISIRHYRDYTILSNTRIKESNIDDNSMTWIHFETTNKISPYQVAIVLTELDYSFNTNWWYRQQMEQEIKFAQTIAGNVTSHLKNIFNTSLSSKIDHVVIPGFRDEGLESWGLVLYRESAIIYNEKLDVGIRKFEVACMIARKMIHQFLGNLVSSAWWSYLWLNEGIATFLAMKIVNEIFNSDIMDLFIVQFQQESFHINDYYDMPLVSKVNKSSDVNSIFNFTYFVKAPIIIRSLLPTIPAESFVMGLNKYLTMYQFKSFKISDDTVDNFFNALQKVLKDVYKLNSHLLKKFIVWMKQERYPVLQVTRISTKYLEIVLLPNPNESYKLIENLWVCVTYTTQKNPNITKTLWLSQNSPVLFLNDINKDHWIVVNIQQAGYYRVNYDNDNWEKLVRYLNSKEYFNIHVVNRAQIIDDAYYFLSTNKLNFNFFKNLTNYLSKETAYVAWYPMFKIFEQISGFFPFPQSIEIKEHFRKILNSVRQKINHPIKLEELKELKKIFPECLRQEVFKWACFFNSSWCRHYAFHQLRNSLYEILPGWEEWTYCYGLSLADNIYVNNMLNTIKLNTKTSDNTFWRGIVLNKDTFKYNKFLKYLACSQDHNFIISYVDHLKLNYTVHDHITIFHSIVARHAKNNLELDYILKNFDNIPWVFETMVVFTDIINHIYAKEQLNMVSNFAKKYPLPKEGNLDIRIRKKIETRMLEIEKHVGYFKSFLKIK